MREVADNIVRTCVFAYSMLCCVPVLGTSAVILRTEQHIVLAADSTLTQGTQGGAASKTCKIKRSGSIYSVIAGIARDDRTDFNIYRMIEGDSVGKDTAEEVARALVGSTRRKHRIALEQIRRDAPAYYYGTSGPKQAQSPLQIILASVWHAQTSYVVLYYTIDNDKRTILVTPHMLKCPGDGCPRPSGRGEYIIGESFIGSKLPFDNIHSSDADYARQIIEWEIKESPKTVGPPIDVLEISVIGGPTWLKNDKNCP